jgi:uncharacterized repeat protein (TIGR01451 family)
MLSSSGFNKSANRRTNRRPIWQRGIAALFVSMLSMMGLPFGPTSAEAALRTFASRFSTNVQGDIVFVANTLLTCTAALNADCSGALAGTNSGAQLNNNNMNMRMLDTDADASTFNSSSANLAMPTGATVLFAGLYWGAKTSLGTTGAPVVPNAALTGQVKFKVPGSTTYATISATTLDNDAASTAFQGFADVTSLVSAAGVGTYTTANVQAGLGADRYAGWTMVVAYSDPNGTMKNLSVFDGFQTVSGTDVSIPVSGFLTPPTGPVNSTIGVVAYEGDAGTAGDKLTVNGTVITDATNATTNFFNSTISNAGAINTSRNPANVNTLGYDSDTTKLAAGILANNATSANIVMSTTGDVYYPGVVTFATELYAPKMTTSKIGTDLNGGQTRVGDVIEYELSVSNTGKDPATNVVLVDPIPANMTYVPGSMQIVSGPNAGPPNKTDAANDDQAVFNGTTVTFYLGNGATPTAGGQMDAFIAPLTTAPTTVVRFRATVGATAPDGVPLVNTAQLTYKAKTLGSVSSTPSTQSSVVVRNEADLSITKTDGAGVATAIAGTPITYTITVASAAGSNPVANAIVSDTMPTALTNVTWTCAPSAGAAGTGATCRTASGSGSINNGVDLLAGSSAVFTVSGTINSSFVGALINDASITAPVGVTETNAANNAASDTDTVSRRADLTINKDDNKLSTTAGSNVSYTIVAKNNGPSAVTGATVTDTPPSVGGPIGWTCVATSGSACPAASGTGNLSAPVDLLPNGTATFTLTYKVDPAATGHLVNSSAIAVPNGTVDPVANNTEGDDDIIDIVSDLKTTKMHSPAALTPGTITTYTITVDNLGPSVSSSATVTDSLPAGLTALGVSSSSWACDPIVGQDITCSATNLPLGQSTIQVSAQIDSSFVGTLTNQAVVSSPNDLVTGNNTGTDATVANTKADLSLSKTHLPATVVAGTNMTYVLGATNKGPSDAQSVLISDPLPAGTSFVSAAGTGWLCANNAGTVECTRSLLASGDSSTVEIVVAIATSQSAEIANTATISSATSDPNNANNAPTDRVTPIRQADVAISKTHVGTFVAGTSITYDIVATNNGPSDAPGTLISDPIPLVMSNVTWTCSATAGSSCSAATGGPLLTNVPVSIASGGTVTIHLSGLLDSAATGAFDNNITIATAGGVVDPNLDNNKGTDKSAVVSRIDLSIAKSNGVVEVIPGQATTYNIIVSNAGPSAAVGATVVDALPAGVSSASWTCATVGGGSCPTSGSGAINALVNLPRGAVATFKMTMNVSPMARGLLTNSASIVAPSGVTDLEPANNTAKDVDTLTPVGDLNIVKTAQAASVEPGSAFSYTVVLTNQGPSGVLDAPVQDILPAELLNATWTCSITTGTGNCQNPSGSGDINVEKTELAPGAQATFTISGSIDPFATGEITNTATVTSPGDVVDPTPNDHDSNVVTKLTPDANLRVTKVHTGTFIPGQPVHYEVIIDNAGPSGAANSRIVDAIPSTLTNVQWTCSSNSGSTCPASGSGSIDELVSIAPGEKVVFSIDADLASSAVGTLTNTATAENAAGVNDHDPSNNTSIDTGPLVPTADLTIAKTVIAPIGNAVAGSPISWKIVVTNQGFSDAPATRIADTIATAVVNPTWTCVASSGSTCAASGSGNIATTVDLAASGTATFTVNGTIAAGFAGTSLSNSVTALLDASVTDPTPGPTTDSTTSTVDHVADLNVTKTNNTATLIPGRTTSYTIVVSNAGPSTLFNVPVADAVPSALLNPTWSCGASAGSTCTDGGGVGSIATTVTLLPGGTATFTLDATVDPDALAGSLKNTASATLPSGFVDPNPGPVTGVSSADDTDTIVPTADLSIEKADLNAESTPGTPITYTIKVTNNGPSNVVSATVSDTLPSALTGATWTCQTPAACSVVSGVGNLASLVTLKSGASVSFILSAMIVAGSTADLSNTATVGVPAGWSDPVTDNNSSTDTNALTPKADISVEKSDGALSVVPGATTTYTIIVSNNGPSFAPSIRVNDNLPPQLLNPSWTCLLASGGTCGSGTGSPSGQSVALASGDVALINISGTIDPSAHQQLAPAGILSNTASITSSIFDPNSSNDSSTDTSTLSPTADLSLVKTDNATSRVPGTNTEYTLTITNPGPSAVFGASVSDIVPTVLSGVTWDCTTDPLVTANSCATASGTGDVATTVDLLPGTSATVKVRGRVASNIIGILTNNASVQSWQR